jgi:zinc transporter ZupT
MTLLILFLVVITGGILAFTLQPHNKNISFLLTFSGAYLLGITLLKFLPHVYEHHQGIGIYVLIGLIFQLVLDFYSKGAEHGHFHSHNTTIFPWSIFIALNIHAFMEGLPLAHEHNHDLLWAIVVHKLPIAIVLTTFLIHSGMSSWKATIFIIFFAMMTPLATFLGDRVSFLIQNAGPINAVVAGSLLHISTTILSESSQDHKFNTYKFVMVVLGAGLAILL